MRGWIWALALSGTACAPEQATSWRTCDEAYAQMELPDAPAPVADLRPIAVGDRLPVLRTSAIEDDADSLANRALALACVMTSDDVAPTDALLEWAEVTLDDPYAAAPEAPPFDVDLSPSSKGPPDLRGLVLRRVRPSDWRPDPSAEDAPEGIGAEAAREVAERTLRRMAEVGLISELDYPLVHAGAVRSHGCSVSGECTPVVTQSYLFFYAASHGGIQIFGSGVDVDVSRDGTLDSVTLYGLEVSAAGDATAVLSEADAATRFDELMQEAWPDREIVEATGDVGYLAPQPDVEASAPVWAESFDLRFSSGDPQRVPPTSERSSIYWLSLTDSDALPILLDL